MSPRSRPRRTAFPLEDLVYHAVPESQISGPSPAEPAERTPGEQYGPARPAAHRPHEPRAVAA